MVATSIMLKSTMNKSSNGGHIYYAKVHRFSLKNLTINNII
jgi:hypothetical protein